MAVLLPLSLSDAPDLAALDKICFGDEAWSEEQIAGSLALTTTRGTGCVEDGKLVGFMLAQLSGDETEILTIGVHPDHRCKGLGRAMLTDRMKRQSSGVLFLDVAVDNAPARAMYESMGFTPFAVRKGYYRRKTALVDAVNYRYILIG